MLRLCELTDVSEAGMMPVEMLSQVDVCGYEERSLGYNRVYTARGAGSDAERIVRIWPTRYAKTNGYAVDDDGTQWRIDVVQRVTNDDGLPVLDLTLVHLDTLYEVVDG